MIWSVNLAPLSKSIAGKRYIKPLHAVEPKCAENAKLIYKSKWEAEAAQLKRVSLHFEPELGQMGRVLLSFFFLSPPVSVLHNQHWFLVFSHPTSLSICSRVPKLASHQR